MKRVRRTALARIAALVCLAEFSIAIPPLASIDTIGLHATLDESSAAPTRHLALVPIEAGLLAVASKPCGDGPLACVRLRVRKHLPPMPGSSAPSGHGAVFHRVYAPPRLWRIVAPPASDPEPPAPRLA